MKAHTAESRRLQEHYSGKKAWLRWGPYLSERQWGTVREDYSPTGDAWEYLPHEHARSRAYRWGEDGLAGICDDECNLCFAIALWNHKDPILKERLFGLTGPQGNQGEDVKELYYYLDSTPTHSYLKHLYKYPQAEYPYEELIKVNQDRNKTVGEYELLDTGVFEENAYFDVFTEYAKADHDDLLIRITIHNRGEQKAPITILPTLWFRHRWDHDPSCPRVKVGLKQKTDDVVEVNHLHLPQYHFQFQPTGQVLFTENETNRERIFELRNPTPYVKDSFHRAVIEGNPLAYCHPNQGTKCAPVYSFELEGGESREIRLRLNPHPVLPDDLGTFFETTFEERIREAGEFYDAILVKDPSKRNIQRQAFAGMLWTKQFYNFDIDLWLNGDPGQPAPPRERHKLRNHHWRHLRNREIISMPDKWEYPWYAAWDLAFHCIPLGMVDINFAKDQLLIFLGERYVHPNGQIPAYEWAFSDVNPPVHAWACIEVYKMEKQQSGKGDLSFLKRAFHKLLLNFTWWVNRKDANDNNIFEGGFLGLDNIGVFDRSKGLPGGGTLEQADGTAWMGLYSLNMLEISLELAREEPEYEDMAVKFLKHYTYIAEALNYLCEAHTGAWDEKEGFFYDILRLPDGQVIPIKVRSLVGLSPLFPIYRMPASVRTEFPNFWRQITDFYRYRQLHQKPLLVEYGVDDPEKDILLTLAPIHRLKKLLQAMLDESEFLSPYGIRSLSKKHERDYQIDLAGHHYELKYEPAESSTYMFGGNSNWRGPVWFPMNYLLLQSLMQLDDYLEDRLMLEYPNDSGEYHCPSEIARRIAKRLISLFETDDNGNRPIHRDHAARYNDPHFKDLILFYEYFHADTGRGVGASHQTGWTGLIAKLIERVEEF